MILEKFGYIRVAAAVPRVIVGDTATQTPGKSSASSKRAPGEDHIRVMVFSGALRDRLHLLGPFQPEEPAGQRRIGPADDT